MEGGREEQDLGALELVHLLHQPALRSRHVHRAQHLAFSLFHPFPQNQILHFSPPFHVSPFPPLVSLSTHYPCTFPTALEGVRRRVAGVGEGNPSSALIGRNRRQPRSHWSALAAAPAWGEGTDCSCGEKGVPKSLQLISLASLIF